MGEIIQKKKQIKCNNKTIELMRLIACISVIGLHTLGIYAPLCGFAVPLFIMISGYLLLDKTDVSITYVINKVLRILKIIFIWSVVWLSFPQVFLGSPGWKENAIYQLINTAYRSILQKDIWQLWYLGVLCILYVFLFLIIKIKRKTKSCGIVLLLWIFFAIFGIIIQSLSILWLNEPIQRSVIQTFRCWTWFQYFLLGGLIKQNEDSIKEKISFSGIAIFTLLLSVFSWIYQTIIGTSYLHDCHAEYFYDDIIFILWSLSVFILILKIPLIYIDNKIVKKLSSLTLGVYIIHPFVIDIIEPFCASLGLDPTLRNVLSFVLITIISFILTYIFDSIPILNQLVRL